MNQFAYVILVIFNFLVRDFGNSDGYFRIYLRKDTRKVIYIRKFLTRVERTKNYYIGFAIFDFKIPKSPHGVMIFN